MARQRYVLRYRGPGAKPAADVDSVRRRPGVTDVDESGAKMLMVECDEAVAAELAENLPDWVMGPEQTYTVPDTRKGVR
jgi:hypothetical protein